MSAAAFPHAYPFRFVDTVSQGATSGGERTAPPGPPTSGGERTAPPGFQGRVRIRVTANARAAMGEGFLFSTARCSYEIVEKAVKAVSLRSWIGGMGV